MKQKFLLQDIVALSKRRGFVYQGSEIYGGLAGMLDYGPLGVELKRNIMQTWWKRFVEDREDIYAVDAAIIMNSQVWQASGHIKGFSDPLVTDSKSGKRYRLDHLLEEAGVIDAPGMSLDSMWQLAKKKGIKSPDGNPLTEPRQFNLMFQTRIGAAEDTSSVSYLRPETAQGIFVNFKNVVDSFHPKFPFGIAQIGKAFRNEITPRDFLFRLREMEQMEIEYFIQEKDWKEYFEKWRKEMLGFIRDIGLSQDKVHELEVPETDRAHYSKRTIDFEYDFPFGRKELYGLAYRTNYDLSKHSEHSKVDLSYFDQETGDRFIPHVIEPTFGVERTVLAVLCNAYTKDNLGGSERIYLNFSPRIAPYKVAVFPLLKNRPELVESAKKVHLELKDEFAKVAFDDNGNIGKRYRRQDEIGTPLCITIDFDTLESNTVTVRDRNTGKQERVDIKKLIPSVKKRLNV